MASPMLCNFISCIFSLVIRHADYICLTVFHGVFLNGSSNCQPKKMYNCMSHWFHLFNFSPLSILKCFLILTFFHYAFLNVSSNCLPEKMHSHTGCMCLTFLHCVFSNAFSNRLLERMHNQTDCICVTFLRSR